MPRHPSVLFISVAAHALLLTALVVLSVLAPDVLPMPRTLLAWDPPHLVHLEDIPLQPSNAAAKPNTASTAVANRPPTDPFPVDASDHIMEETGREGSGATVGVEDVAVDPGTTGIAGLGIVEAPSAPRALRTPVRLHSGIDAPRKTVDVAPTYPEIARQVHAQGIVILEATISETGDVVTVRILRSMPLLDRAAVDAVKQWRFTPARLNGEAIPVVMTVTVNFALGR